MKIIGFKNLIISLAVFGYLLSPASAFAGSLSCYVASAPDNPADFKVLEMSAMTNAHAALPDQVGYPFAVYCGGLSGLSASCSGNHEIVAKLSSISNAHAREGNQPDGTDGAHYLPSQYVCLSGPSGATITVEYQDGNCSGYDTTIASMSKSPSNAHLGGAGDYTRQICASATGANLTTRIFGFSRAPEEPSPAPVANQETNLEPVPATENNTAAENNDISIAVAGTGNNAPARSDFSQNTGAGFPAVGNIDSVSENTNEEISSILAAEENVANAAIDDAGLAAAAGETGFDPTGSSPAPPSSF